MWKLSVSRDTVSHTLYYDLMRVAQITGRNAHRSQGNSKSFMPVRRDSLSLQEVITTSRVHIAHLIVSVSNRLNQTLLHHRLIRHMHHIRQSRNRRRLARIERILLVILRRRRRDRRQVATESLEVRRHARRAARGDGVADVVGCSVCRGVAAAGTGHGVCAMRLEVDGGLGGDGGTARCGGAWGTGCT